MKGRMNGRRMRVFPIWLFMAMLVLVPFMSAPAHADEVKVIVNGVVDESEEVVAEAAE